MSLPNADIRYVLIERYDEYASIITYAEILR